MTDADGGTRSERTARPDTDASNRRRAALATLPFVGLALAVATLAVVLALQPLWAFLLVPPIAFVSILTHLTFRSDFLEGR